MIDGLTALSLAEMDENKKIWAFFDEFNTTDELSYIKEILVEHRFMGK